jgi:hypothetical protein
MLIKGEYVHFMTQAVAAISSAINREIEFGEHSQHYAVITKLEIDNHVLLREIRKWGEGMERFVATVDIAVHDEQSDEEQFDFDFWQGRQYQILLTPLRETHGSYVAAAKYVEGSGAQKPEVRIGQVSRTSPQYWLIPLGTSTEIEETRRKR